MGSHLLLPHFKVPGQQPRQVMARSEPGLWPGLSRLEVPSKVPDQQPYQVPSFRLVFRRILPVWYPPNLLVLFRSVARSHARSRARSLVRSFPARGPEPGPEPATMPGPEPGLWLGSRPMPDLEAGPRLARSPSWRERACVRACHRVQTVVA